MPTFVREVVIDAPVADVFAFHERDDALPLLSPAFPPVRVVGKSGGIEAGGRVELRVAGLIKWVALHVEYDRNRLFVDEQVEGPFRKWRHFHEFESIGARTRLRDRVEYELPGGAWMNTLAAWLVTAGLNQMFRHRHRVTRHYCEARR